MIKSIKDVNSSGDALEFVEDNFEFFERIEKAIHALWIPANAKTEYDSVAQFLEFRIEELLEQSRL